MEVAGLRSPSTPTTPLLILGASISRMLVEAAVAEAEAEEVVAVELVVEVAEVAEAGRLSTTTWDSLPWEPRRIRMKPLGSLV